MDFCDRMYARSKSVHPITARTSGLLFTDITFFTLRKAKNYLTPVADRARVCACVHVRASGIRPHGRLYSRARRAHAVFIRKRLITNTVRRTECNIFLYACIQKKKDKKNSMKIRYIGVRCAQALHGRVTICFIDFSSDIIAHVGRMQSSSQFAHQRNKSETNTLRLRSSL